MVVRPHGGTIAHCIAVTSRLALWLVGAVQVPLASALLWAPGFGASSAAVVTVVSPSGTGNLALLFFQLASQEP